MNSPLAFVTDKFLYFFWVCKTGSIQSASRKLNVSAPSLSVAIKKLEKALGITLFFRTKNGMTLTEQGKRVFSFCERFYDNLEHLAHDLLDQGENKKFYIKIGTFQSIAIYFFPLLLKEFQKYRQISLSLRTDRSFLIQEALIKDEIDIALTVEAPSHQKLTSVEIYKDSYSFYVSKKESKLKSSSSISLASLKKMLSSRSLLFIPSAIDSRGVSLDKQIRGMDIETKNSFELDSFEVIANFTENNYGVGILPNLVAKRYVKTLKKIEVDNPKYSNFGEHRIFLTFRNNLELPSKLIEGIVKSVQTAARNI